MDIRRFIGIMVSGVAIGSGMTLVTDAITWRGLAATVIIVTGMTIGDAIRRPPPSGEGR